MDDDFLEQTLARALDGLERRNQIILCADDRTAIAAQLGAAVRSVWPDAPTTTQEMAAVRALIFHALADKRFFDLEMPTLTGLNADGFRSVAGKLPTG